MHKIVRISVFGMYESCERWTYYVRTTTDEGLHKEVEGHRSKSLYNPDGISREEARDRALIDAATWGDFLGITPDPFEEDGVVHEPSMTFDTFTMERELKERRARKNV